LTQTPKLKVAKIKGSTVLDSAALCSLRWLGNQQIQKYLNC